MDLPGDEEIENAKKGGGKRDKFDHSGLHALTVTGLEIRQDKNKVPFIYLGLVGAQGSEGSGRKTSGKVDFVGRIPAKGTRPEKKKVEFLIKFLRSIGLSDEGVKGLCAKLASMINAGDIPKAEALLRKNIEGKTAHADLVRGAYKGKVYSEPKYFVTPDEYAAAVKNGTALREPEEVEAGYDGDDGDDGATSETSASAPAGGEDDLFG